MTVSSLSRSDVLSAASGNSFFQSVTVLMLHMHERRKARRAVRELRALSGHTLKDIGLHRSEATSVVFTDTSERRRGYAGH